MVYIEEVEMVEEVGHYFLSEMEVDMVEEVGLWQSHYFLLEMEVGMGDEEYSTELVKVWETFEVKAVSHFEVFGLILKKHLTS
jgi:hypothetical protein